MLEGKSFPSVWLVLKDHLIRISETADRERRKKEEEEKNSVLENIIKQLVKSCSAFGLHVMWGNEWLYCLRQPKLNVHVLAARNTATEYSFNLMLSMSPVTTVPSDFYLRETLGDLGGSVGGTSESWFLLRLWSQYHEIKPHFRLHVQRGWESAWHIPSPSAPPPHTLSLSLK